MYGLVGTIGSPNHTFSWAHAVVSLGGEYSDILVLYVGEDHFLGFNGFWGFHEKKMNLFFRGGV